MRILRLRPVKRDISWNPRSVHIDIKRKVNDAIYYKMLPRLMNSIQEIYGTKY